jgi:hypothetical protein
MSKIKLILSASILLLVSGQVNSALIVDDTQSVRADFEISIVSPFTLPAYILSYTVEFDRANLLNPGEGYKVTSYDSNGVELGMASYINSFSGSIISCSCTDIRVDPLLETINYFAIIDSLGGSFDVSNVYSLAFDADNGLGNSISSIGSLKAIPSDCSQFPGGGATEGCFPGPGPFPGKVPEPPAILLFGIGLIGLIGFTKRRKSA